MAALTLADYKSLVRGYLDESRAIVSQRYPDADITRALNNGGRRIVRDAELFFYRNTATMNAAAGDITPPTDFLGNGSVTLVISSTERRSLPTISAKDKYKKQPNWVSETAQYPTEFVTKITPSGIRGVLWPTIQTTITNGLFWEYAALPTAMADATDTVDTFLPLAAFEELQPVLLPAAALTELLHIEAGVLDLQWKKWDALYWQNIQQLRAYVNGLFQPAEQYGMS